MPAHQTDFLASAKKTMEAVSNIFALLLLFMMRLIFLYFAFVVPAFYCTLFVFCVLLLIFAFAFDMVFGFYISTI